jgi:hypothetical protein
MAIYLLRYKRVSIGHARNQKRTVSCVHFPRDFLRCCGSSRRKHRPLR